MKKGFCFLRNGVAGATFLSVFSKGTINKVVLFAVFMIFSSTFFAQENGLQITGGYIPNQKLSVNPKSSAITFDMTGWLFTDLENYASFGFGGGFGIRSYRNIAPEELLNSDDPYKKNAARFDVHVGPGLGFGYAYGLYFVLSPQFGLWYAGMSNAGPKLNFTTALNADMVLGGVVTLGVTYRPTSSRLVSTNWSFGSSNSYIQIEPALEFRIGLFLLEQ